MNVFREKAIKIYVDSQLKPYRQIFGVNEEVRYESMFELFPL